MQMRCFVAVLFVVMVGCDQQQQALVPPQVPKQAPPPPVPTVSQPEAAKAHIQKYIDRLTGGDQSVKLGLLGFEGAIFERIDSIEIKSAVPTYTQDGKKVEDMVRVVIHVKGFHLTQSRNIEKNINRDVTLKDGKWSIDGSSGGF